MEETFLIDCLLNNNYDRKIVEKLDLFMDEGPYGYTDGDFDVTIKEDDVVIDAGAWIGDFSAYSVSRGGGGRCYAFEPTKKTFDILKETARLNSRIIPVQTALGACEAEGTVFFAPHHSGGNTTLEGMFNSVLSEKIKIDSLDNFVEKNNIEKIDFIKADIEGAERDMLLGAAKTLKKFQPKLAICTYHLPDDPEILEKTILKINPNYRIRHLRKKLFACVCGR
jgi:FkbM family methyltransferase